MGYLRSLVRQTLDEECNAEELKFDWILRKQHGLRETPIVKPKKREHENLEVQQQGQPGANATEGLRDSMRNDEACQGKSKRIRDQVEEEKHSSSDSSAGPCTIANRDMLQKLP